MTILSFPKLGLEIPINRVAFSIGSWDFYWYGIIIAVGFVLAAFYALRRAKSFGVDPDKFIDVLLGATIGGIVGARLYYVAFAWSEFSDNIWRIFDIHSGGMAFYGGVIGGFGVGYLICRLRKVRFLPLADLAGIGFLIGQGIGRWGNFVNIEAFGSNTSLPWGMTSDSIVWYLQNKAASLSALGVTVDPAMPVHPCFLYESLWCLLGVLVLHLLSKHRRYDGEMLLGFIGWNGLGRVWIEGLRTDSLMLGNIRISQLLAGLAVLVCIFLLIFFRAKIRRQNDPAYWQPYVRTEAWQQELKAIEERENKARAGKKAKTEELETLTEQIEQIVEGEEPAAPADSPAGSDENGSDSAGKTENQ